MWEYRKSPFDLNFRAPNVNSELRLGKTQQSGTLFSMFEGGYIGRRTVINTFTQFTILNEIVHSITIGFITYSRSSVTIVTHLVPD